MNILLLPGPYGYSHSTRLLQLGKILSTQNCNIAVCLNEKQAQLPWGDCTFYAAPDFPRITDYNENIYEVASEELLDAYVSAEIKAIRDFKPDFILADLRPTATISAKLEKIPLITIQNAALSKNFAPYDYLNIEVSDRDKRKYRRQAATKSAKIFTNVAKKRGVRELRDLFDFINGDYNWICDLETLFPIKKLSSKDTYIGPLLFENSQINTSPIPPLFLLNKKVFVYITLGNTGDQKQLNLYINAFAENTYCNVVITTGLNQDIPYEGFIHPHIFLTSYISGEQILPHADLIIHHGGSGTMYQALKYKVPSIVIPYNTEQRINAMAIEKTKTGIVLDIRKLNPEHLLERARTVYQHQEALKKNIDPISAEINAFNISLVLKESLLFRRK